MSVKILKDDYIMQNKKYCAIIIVAFLSVPLSFQSMQSKASFNYKEFAGDCKSGGEKIRVIGKKSMVLLFIIALIKCNFRFW